MTRTNGSNRNRQGTLGMHPPGRPGAWAGTPARAVRAAAFASAEALEDRRLFADTIAPTAVLTNAPQNNPAGAAYTYSVTYQDNVAINQSTIDNNDTLVTGPGGINQLGALLGTPTNNGSGSFTARYQVTAPPLGGIYVISMESGEVADTSGNFVAPLNLGQFTQAASSQQTGSTDKIPPTALVTGTPTADPSGLGYNVNVTYTDDDDLLDATIGDGDIQVTGPSYNQVGKLVKFVSSAKGIRVAQYRVANPIIKGNYTVTVQQDEVSDLAGNFVAAGGIGTFAAGFANTGGGGVQVPGGGPNFNPPDVAAAVTDVPDSIATLGKGKVTVRVTNLGDSSTPSKVRVALFLSDNTILGSADPQMFEAATSKLKGGQSKTVTFKVKFPDVPAGNYFVIAKADPDDTLKEKSETNNVGVSTKTVAVTVPSVDLMPSFVSDLPTEVVGGDSGRVTLNIANKGTATFLGGANITLYASADNVLDTTVDPVVKQVSGLPLKIGIGGDKNVKINFNYPLNLPDGSYQFIATVNSGKAVDSNLSNNTAVTPDTVFIRRAFIDIRADSISVISGPLRVGGVNVVEVKVTNLGNVAVRGPLGISLAATSPTLAGAVPLVKVVRQANLKPLGSQKFKVSFQLPPSLPSSQSPGYFFQAVVDPDQIFSESDETNNAVTTVNPFPTQ